MPVVTIAGNECLSNDDKSYMVEKASEIVSKAYGLPLDAITVLVQSYSPENVGVGGQLLSKK